MQFMQYVYAQMYKVPFWCPACLSVCLWSKVCPAISLFVAS